MGNLTREWKEQMANPAILPAQATINGPLEGVVIGPRLMFEDFLNYVEALEELGDSIVLIADAWRRLLDTPTVASLDPVAVTRTTQAVDHAEQWAARATGIRQNIRQQRIEFTPSIKTR